jgi:hypothetical protein
MLRLTLRTLLAYLDDTLQPAESRHIGQQIAQEPAINDLVSRIQAVMRKPRLLADSADPDHAEVDPNDMAEYLDSVLTPARVADLEKRLLEHDSDLAEAASVHQILSLVLGKPSEVPGRARERAYKLIRSRHVPHIEQEPIGPIRTGSTGGGNSVAPLGGPDELASSAPLVSLGTAMLVACLVGLLAVTVYFTLSGQKERAIPPLAAAGEKKDGVDGSTTADVTAVAERKNGTAVAESARGGESSEQTPPVSAEPSTTEARPGNSIIPERVGEPSAVEEPPGEKQVADRSSGSSEPASDAVDTKPAANVALPKDELDALPGESVPLGGDKKEEKQEPTAPSKVEEDETGAAPIAESATDPTAEGEDLALAKKPAMRERTEPPAVRPVPVATYVSQTGILHRFSEGKWSRVTPRSKLQSGEVLAFAEPARAKIELPTGAVIEMVGPTRLGLRFDPTVDFAFDLLEGRVVMASKDEPTSVKLHVDSTVGTLLLDGPSQRVAAEYRLFGPPKDEPATSVIREVDLTCLEGKVEWQQGGATVSMGQGEQISLRSDEENPPSPAVVSQPTWVESAADGPTEKILGRLSDEISFTGSPIDRYRELIDDNNKEIRLLAVDALASMRQVDALAEAIRHPKHEPIRRRSLAALRLMTRERGESQTLVKTSLEKFYGPDAAPLLELLDFRTSAIDRPRESFKRWIDLLNAGELCVREAAISQLVDLTGRDLSYSAEGISSQRNVAVGKWTKWLDSQSDEQLTKLLMSSP